MEIHTFFLFLLVILLTARVFAELASRLQTPPVIGEILAGVLLGPSLLGWIEPVEVIRLLAGIGIILLLFEVGLDTDVRRLARSGFKAIVVALPGFFLPLVSGFALAFWIFEMPLLTSLFVGGTMTATSIGITVRVLADLNRQHSSEGEIVLGAAGLAVSRRFFLPLGLALRADPQFAQRIEIEMKPVIRLFTPIFFVMVGLIFAELGRVSGILTNEVYAGMVIVITLTTFSPPFIMKWFYRRYGDSMPGYSGPAQAVR